jgi:hypothetical protein
MRWAIGKPGETVRQIMNDHGSPNFDPRAQVLPGEIAIPIGDRQLDASPAMPVTEKDDFTYPRAAQIATAEVRRARDAMLAATDWTQIGDVPLGPTERAAWVAYRRALRDLPAAQPGATMATVKWPETPA